MTAFPRSWHLDAALPVNAIAPGPILTIPIDGGKLAGFAAHIPPQVGRPAR